jgi:hypothetical protein
MGLQQLFRAVVALADVGGDTCDKSQSMALPVNISVGCNESWALLSDPVMSLRDTAVARILFCNLALGRTVAPEIIPTGRPPAI